MTPPSWGIPAVLVLGVVLIAFGWWWDRRRTKDAAGFVTEDQIAELPEAAPTLTDTDLDALMEARAETAALPAGLADRAFLTHRRRGVAAVRDALVLVTDADLDDERLLLTVLARAQEAGTPLVLVAPSFGFGLLSTLHANARSARLSTVPVELGDRTLRRKAAQLTGGRVVSASDLAADWVPTDALGRAAWWVADEDDSWLGDARA